MIRGIVASAGVAILLPTFGCNRRPAKPLAHVAGAWIGQEQWAEYLKVHTAPTLAEGLHALVNRELAFADLNATGKLNIPEWRDFLVKTQRTVVGQAYLAKQGGPSTITEAEAKLHFQSKNEERHVLHLLCKTQPEAEAALKRLQKGENFEKVAAAISKDPSAKENHGDLGWIKRAQVVQPFAKAVFEAKLGELCGPFETSYGWHVARAVESRGPSDEAYLKNRDKVLVEMEILRTTMNRPEVLKALKAQFPLKIDKAVLGLDKTTDFAPGDGGRIAGSIGSMTISLQELKQYISEYFKASGVNHGLGAQIKGQFLELMADDLRLAAAGEKAGLDKRPEVQAMLWEMNRTQALKFFSATYLDAYTVPEAELKAHHSQFPTRFLGAGSVKLNLLVIDREQDAALAAKEAQNKVSWQILFDKYANKDSTGNWDAGFVEIAALAKIFPKEVIKVMSTLETGGLIGPVPGPEGFMIFKVLDRKPGATMPFDECRNAVRNDFINDQGAKLVEKHIDATLRGKYPIQEFPENASPLPSK